MAVISNSAAQTYIVNLKGKRKRTVTGVMSVEHTDIMYYDSTSYRDELDASFIGTPRSLIAHETGGISNQDALIPNGSTLNVAGSSGSTIGFPAMNDPHLEESDSFKHEPPRPEQKTTTYLRFWDEAAAAGNLLYEVERVLVEDWGIAATGEPTVIT